VIGSLETGIIVAVLEIGMAREDSRDVEYYGCLFIGEGVLGGWFVGESVEPVKNRLDWENGCTTDSIPSKRDLDVVLVHRESQIEQFELAIVSVQQVSARGAVLAGASHVLAQPVKHTTFFRVALRIVAICVAYVGLERRNPVDLVGLLERTRQHGRLSHHVGGIV
jgi:hypothetical protein